MNKIFAISLSLLAFGTVTLFQNCAKGLPDIAADNAQANSSLLAAGGCKFDGEVVANGQSLEAYSSASAVDAATCTAASETRNCSNGNLSGSFTFSSCIVAGNSSGSTINLTLANNASNVNIASIAGSPIAPVTVNLTINSGVAVSATSTAVAALTTGVLPVGSVVNIINNGAIYGAGGAGGTGGGGATAGLAGGPGGPALNLNYAVSITNPGIIAGGGGGGGGGAGCAIHGDTAGGGGGGGSGSAGGASGAAGPFYYYAGVAGGAGSVSGAGAGGAGALSGDCASGGTGGTFGAAGSAGAPYGSVPASITSSAGVGGAAGAAVIANGFTINWVSGGATPNRLGAIQ